MNEDIIKGVVIGIVIALLIAALIVSGIFIQVNSVARDKQLAVRVTAIEDFLNQIVARSQQKIPANIQSVPPAAPAVKK